MDNNLIPPILERISLGQDKDAIKQEVLGLGYNEEEFEAAYKEAAALEAENTPPVQTESGTEPVKESKEVFGLVIKILIGLVLLGLIGWGLYFSYTYITVERNPEDMATTDESSEEESTENTETQEGEEAPAENKKDVVSSVVGGISTYEEYEEEIKKCYTYDEEKGMECINSIIVEISGKDICKQIEKASTKMYCYKEIAQSTQNISLCNNIPMEEVRLLRLCYKDVYKTSTDSTICNEVSDEYYEPEETTMQSSFTVDGVVMYEQTYYGEYQRQDCLNVVARNQEDFETCKTIKDNERLKFGCLLETAKKENNPERCNDILQVESKFKNYPVHNKDECYEAVAASLKDASLCENIEDENTSDWCYIDVARATNNTSLCDNVVDNFYKSQCLDPKYY